MSPAKAPPSATVGLITNPKARLLDEVREVMRFHYYSLRTEEAYVQWIRRYLQFCRDTNPLTPALSPGGGEGVSKRGGIQLDEFLDRAAALHHGAGRPAGLVNDSAPPD
jgi:hypothetical protein